ncbi:2-hydroxychromene-2-carboxylate isomerase [Cupriavidus gilardii]|uniref:2-hydroxychromene-2-carboxylate isomerase n=1 Tax=Cupriavidus gilardii TaxID=82541 RepID=UPI0007E42AE3|nr:2-hydroxychromene-2-carboxylate isomerase [Cupriavidus gilardii]
MRPAPPPTLEFWFEFGSNYSYLSAMRIEPLAARHGVTLAWKPFLLGPVFSALGWQGSPFVVQRAKGAYAMIDTARQCAKYGLPWRQPSQFPRRALLPMRVALLGAGEPWIGAYCRRIMRMNFAEDRDIDNAEAVGEALAELGLPADALLSAAVLRQNKEALRAQTDRALHRGVFGAPTFFVGEQMFWGNDRLEDALAFAIEQQAVTG